MKLKIGTVLTIIALLFGAYFWVDTTKADASTVEKLSSRLDLKIDEDKCFHIQRRLWALEDRYPESYKTNLEYRELSLELETLKKRMGGK